MLFIDARNYYTVADRTLNEWSEWQLRNMNAIVWLYRGEQEAYQSLLGEYHAAITEGLSGIRRIEHHFMQKLSGRAHRDYPTGCTGGAGRGGNSHGEAEPAGAAADRAEIYHF